ncbi:hypothetical protein EV586_103180 [Tumebacillus sp. BK434]|uniref:hypothetical protein n=1 Tax=Tumebacillus sp. BK434 TaxID=2512169 RepID=UPI00104706BB|nr:hypothetical protein [Tumebacillus sp. BK434]TCP55527.1 hypothetical protein EV586_103180 [Tumebacillus sp. BK434]
MYRNEEELVQELQQLAHAKPRAEFARALEARLRKEAPARKRPRYRLIGGVAVAMLALTLTATMSSMFEVRGTPAPDAHTGLIAYTVSQNQQNVLHLADPQTLQTKKTIDLGKIASTKIFEAPDGRLWIPLNRFGSHTERTVVVVDPTNGSKQTLSFDQAPDSVFFQGDTAYIVSLTKPRTILIYQVKKDMEPKLVKSVPINGTIVEPAYYNAQFRFTVLNSEIQTLIVPLAGEPIYLSLDAKEVPIPHVLTTDQNVLMLLQDGTQSKLAEYAIPSMERLGLIDLHAVDKPLEISHYEQKASVPDQQKMAFIGIPKGQDRTYVMIYDTVTGDLVRSFPTQHSATSLKYDKDSNRWYVMSKDTVEVFTFEGQPVATLQTDGLLSNFVLN